MYKEELIQRLKRIKYLMFDAENLHDRAALGEANDEMDKLLKDFGVDVPSPLPRGWWKSE
ncbi:hypothetical protein M3610_10385 [Neobacillus sp. MER 74]|uniref:hypothetical protein n=1 Tax=Neobacillus sp. MER 74 TaxID=2939566 RepID=UPI00203DD680|nr:hypothetical protein [Neobacillus sp. MER 74]MCM3115695.1 hypothetical protein [Neobacillus sp. MER 74]